VGLGDEIMATGFAKGAKARGKIMAFGNGRYVTSPWQEIIFKNNPNIAWPRDVGRSDVEWCSFCKGHRIYNHRDPTGRRRWIWNYEFKAQPGEFFFSSDELEFASKISKGFALIEPHVPRHKSVAPNKTWEFSRFQAVADKLLRDDYRVFQFKHHSYPVLERVEVRESPSIRHSAAAMRRASVVITPEGGTHHAAAAVGARAVVIFGGFIPPQALGYSAHTNLTGGASEFCGELEPCSHCAEALKAISVEEVYAAALGK
jgi:ADP-heptose:LPS heptosyltransferase